MRDSANNPNGRRANDLDVARALGRIEGKIDALQISSRANSDAIKGLDTRLRAVEKTSAVHGAVGGVLAGTGVTLIVEFLKRSIGN
jgi:hypothetical protein